MINLQPHRYKLVVTLNGTVTNEGGGHTMDDALKWYEEHRQCFPIGHTYELVDTLESQLLEDEKREKKKGLRKKLKAMKDADWKGTNTIVELKQIMRDLIDLMDDT